MVVDYIAMGGRIRACRCAKGLTQEALAELCGISFSFLGHIERGTRKMSLETLASLSSVLKISADELLFGTSSNDEITQLLSRLSSLQFQSPAQRKSFAAAVTALIQGVDLF